MTFGGSGGGGGGGRYHLVRPQGNSGVLLSVPPASPGGDEYNIHVLD